MLRIRFHGRGGQGMKTAARLLSGALFREGFEVQDAPRYGAERRGAPMSASVRAARAPIAERGPVDRPDLVVVADETLVPVAAAGVLRGVDAHTALLLMSDESAETWRARLALAGPVIVLPAPPDSTRPQGAACAAAAARLTGLVGREALLAAVSAELAGHGEEVVRRDQAAALAAWERVADQAGCVRAGADPDPRRYAPPAWITPPLDGAEVAAPDIHAGLTSVLTPTGLWRSQRPVIDEARCNRCAWICSTFCPDSAIEVDAEGRPRIDYDHCKGCLVCVAVCPPHAIHAVPEHEAAAPPP